MGLYEKLTAQYKQILGGKNSSDFENIDEEIFEILNSDINVIKNSIDYWNTVFDIYNLFLSEIDDLILGIQQLNNEKRPIEEIEIPYNRSKLNSLANKEDILTINQIENILKQVEDLQRKEEAHNQNSENYKVLRKFKAKEEKLNTQLSQLKSKKENINHKFEEKQAEIKKLKQLAEKIEEKSSHETNRQLRQKEKELAKDINQMIKFAQSKGQRKQIETSRRNFIQGFAATVFTAQGLGDELYSAFNKNANKVAFEVVGSGRTPPKKYYDNSNPFIIDKAINGTIEVEIHNLAIGKEDKHDRPSYPNQKIINHIETQFRRGLGIDININWHETLIENKTTNRSNLRYKSALKNTKLRGTTEEDMEKLEELRQNIITDLSSKGYVESHVTNVVAAMSVGYFQPAAVANSDERHAFMNREKTSKLSNLIIHELGHIVGLPHNKGRDIMSYSPERYLNQSLGLINPAFREESQRDWEKIKQIHEEEYNRNNNPLDRHM